MRSHRDGYEPFLDTSSSAEEHISFDDYCDSVSSSIKAEWGGQLEIRALSEALRWPIWVYDAMQPTVRMGEGDKEPIRVSFHRHFYSLGEHYNAVVAKR